MYDTPCLSDSRTAVNTAGSGTPQAVLGAFLSVSGPSTGKHFQPVRPNMATFPTCVETSGAPSCVRFGEMILRGSTPFGESLLAPGSEVELIPDPEGG